jgi:hypothetical protein
MACPLSSRTCSAVLGGARRVAPLARVRAQLAEHGSGLDAGQLVAVPEQHQARLRRQRVDQVGHHLQMHHRRLVDQQHVDVQRVAGVMLQAPRVAEQRVQRTRGEAQRRGVATQAFAQLRQRGVERLLQARRGLVDQSSHPIRFVAMAAIVRAAIAGGGPPEASER